MKKVWMMVIVGLTVSIGVMSGCTRIVKMTPCSGPPGTSVELSYENAWGDPGTCSLYFDGQKVCEPFLGRFSVPDSAQSGKHSVILVDNIDATEAFLVFPLFRNRIALTDFMVSE